MALIRWQPFSEIETLQRQLDRVFNEMTVANRPTETAWKPAVELQDAPEHLTLKAQLPGIEGKDLDIRVTREAVAISGEHRYENKTSENGVFRSEFRYGKFERVIPLPVAVQNDKVEAEFNNGILTLTLPKVDEAKNRVVKVNLGNDTPQAETATEQA